MPFLAKAKFSAAKNLATVLGGKRNSWRPKSQRDPGENLATILETKCGACSYVKPTLMKKDLPNQIIPVKF